MNIMMIKTPSFGYEDAKDSLKKTGHNVYEFFDELLSERVNDKFSKHLDTDMVTNQIDIVFSLNYYPIVSMGCKKRNVRYISIVYDNPHIALYHFSLINDCNYIFVFDYSQYSELKNGGVNTVYYLPLPVNVSRYDRQIKKDKKYIDDVSFVGSLYNESHTLYDRLREKLQEVKGGKYVNGYLDGLVEAQSRIDGYLFLEEMLRDDLLKVIEEAYPYGKPKDSIATPKYVYANYFMGRKATEIARLRILRKVSKTAKLSLYTPNPQEQIPEAIFKGAVDWYTKTPDVFYRSKINLNISLKSIKTGIPFRVLDIMASGGFVLTNYQEDMFRHFEADKDFVFYSDEEDLLQKIKYYLENDEERERIAENGYRKVKELCEYEKVISKILCMVERV